MVIKTYRIAKHERDVGVYFIQRMLSHITRNWVCGWCWSLNELIDWSVENVIQWSMIGP